MVRAVVVALVAALALIAVTALLPEPHTRPVLEPASAPVESIEPVTVSDGSDVTVTSLG